MKTPEQMGLPLDPVLCWCGDDLTVQHLGRVVFCDVCEEDKGRWAWHGEWVVISEPPGPDCPF